MEASDLYIQSKKNSWTSATIKSETSRLNRIRSFVECGDTEGLWDNLKTIGKYSRVTYWTRAIEYYDFLLEEKYREGINVFRKWRRSNARPFKNAYMKKQPNIGYKDVVAAINSFSNPKVKQEVLSILRTGMRISERHKVGPDGFVIGKGDKRRKIYGLEYMPDLSVSDNRIRKCLKSIGLTPHDLRKIRATDLVRKNLKEADLCKVMGWSSFNTASSYIAPINDDKIEEVM